MVISIITQSTYFGSHNLLIKNVSRCQVEEEKAFLRQYLLVKGKLEDHFQVILKQIYYLVARKMQQVNGVHCFV